MSVLKEFGGASDGAVDDLTLERGAAQADLPLGGGHRRGLEALDLELGLGEQARTVGIGGATGVRGYPPAFLGDALDAALYSATSEVASARPSAAAST